MRNGEGYSDPTASRAIGRADRENRAYERMLRLRALLNHCADAMGCRIVSMEIMDRSTRETLKQR